MQAVTMALVSFAWIALHIEPYFTNKFYFYAEANVTEQDVDLFKILNYAKNGMLLITWFVASSNNKSSL